MTGEPKADVRDSHRRALIRLAQGADRLPPYLILKSVRKIKEKKTPTEGGYATVYEGRLGLYPVAIKASHAVAFLSQDKALRLVSSVEPL